MKWMMYRWWCEGGGDRAWRVIESVFLRSPSYCIDLWNFVYFLCIPCNIFFYCVDYFLVYWCFCVLLLCLVNSSLSYSISLCSAFFRKYISLLVEMVQWLLFDILVMLVMSERNHCHIISLWFSRYWCFSSLSSTKFQFKLFVHFLIFVLHFIVLMVSLWRPGGWCGMSGGYHWQLVVACSVLTVCDRPLSSMKDLIANYEDTVSLPIMSLWIVIL